MIAQAHDDRDPAADHDVALDDNDSHSDSPAADETRAARSRRGIGGPKTPEGKFRSAQNALKHGLRATVLLPDDLAARAAQRRDAMIAEFRPASAYQSFLIDQAALATARIERCQEIERALIQRKAEAAETPTGWLAEARGEVEEIAAKLARDPARTVAMLRKTTHGVDWLLRRWAGLIEALECHGGWNADQIALARDLLGVPRDLRNPCLELPDDASTATLGYLAVQATDELQHEQAEHLDEQDIQDRARTSLGVPVRRDRELETIRRYERECRRTLRQTLDEFHRLRGESETNGEMLKEAMGALLAAMPPHIRAQLRTWFQNQNAGEAGAGVGVGCVPDAPEPRGTEEWPMDDPLDLDADHDAWSDDEEDWCDSDDPEADDADGYVGDPLGPDVEAEMARLSRLAEALTTRTRGGSGHASDPDHRRARNRKRARAQKREAARRRRSG